MYLFELSINLPKENQDEILDEFIYLEGSLRFNGQILSKTQPGGILDNKLFSVLMCPDKDSLDKKYHNNYVSSRWEKVEKLSGSTIHVKYLGKDIEAEQNQCCGKTTFYILYTNYLSNSSPLKCGNCFNSVPLYKIPNVNDDGYGNLISWQSNYQACDTLNMNCEVGEKFALKQMYDYNSELSSSGISLCKKIKKLTGIPVYYYLLNYRKINNKKDIETKCPSCEGKWLLNSQLLHLFDFKCDRCRLLSNLSFRS